MPETLPPHAMRETITDLLCLARGRVDLVLHLLNFPFAVPMKDELQKHRGSSNNHSSSNNSHNKFHAMQRQQLHNNNSETQQRHAYKQPHGNQLLQYYQQCAEAEVAT